jgi:hypothetical protein
MSLDEKFIPIQNCFLRSIVYGKLAGLFGYPGNPGMSTFMIFQTKKMPDFLKPTTSNLLAPIQRPETYLFDI